MPKWAADLKKELHGKLGVLNTSSGLWMGGLQAASTCVVAATSRSYLSKAMRSLGELDQIMEGKGSQSLLVNKLADPRTSCVEMRALNSSGCGQIKIDKFSEYSFIKHLEALAIADWGSSWWYSSADLDEWHGCFPCCIIKLLRWCYHVCLPARTAIIIFMWQSLMNWTRVCHICWCQYGLENSRWAALCM